MESSSCAFVNRPFLADGQRRGVFEMRASDLDDVFPFPAISVSIRARRAPKCRQRFFRHHFVGAAMCIAVGNVSLLRLTHIDVIVGMNRLLRTLVVPPTSWNRSGSKRLR